MTAWGVGGSFWSCFSEIRDPFDLSPGYDDDIGQRYAFDSHVPNHLGVGRGDVLVVRDAQVVHGFSVVERVESRPGVKAMRRCPSCRSAGMKPRKTLTPRFRCNKCKNTFNEPISELSAVTEYLAHYERRWFPFLGVVPPRVLEAVYVGKDQQNAIRRLDPAGTVALLTRFSGVEGAIALQLPVEPGPIDGGFVDVFTRARLGQQRFRAELLKRFDSVCAVTGPQPVEVLEAAHLYSYAEEGEHRLDGGLLLRADVHRMFDRLLLTIDPTLTTQVAPPLLDRYPHLEVLDHRRLYVPDHLTPDLVLLREHQELALTRWHRA